MAEPSRFGLSNPYAPRQEAVPAGARSHPRLARAAVLVGVSGAAAVGLGSGAWADTSTAAPVDRHESGPGVACDRLHQPVMHGASPSAAAVPGAWPRRCTGAVPWLRDRPLPVDPIPVRYLVPEPIVPAPEPSDPLQGSQVVAVAGTVDAGVEPGCVVLRGGDGQQWTLVGPLRTLPHGVPMDVTGVTEPQVLSTCMQGPVLRVRQVRLLDPGEDTGSPVPIATTDLLAREAVPATPVRVAPVAPSVQPACGPIGLGKIPSVALCTR